jgi:uncharacterized surface protein with fasciclin (FAS1) repeats
MRLMKWINRIILLAGLILLLVSCEKQHDDTGFFTEDMLSISTFLEQHGDEYSIFWQIVEKTGMYHALNAYNPSGDGFTLFLPTDEAFERYFQESDAYHNPGELLNDAPFCAILGRYHLVNKSIRTTEFPFGALSDSTATGDYLTIGIDISGDTAQYRVNNVARLIVHDIELTNGYIHVIDHVLEPIVYSSFEWLKNHSGYSILSGAMEMTGLSQKMGIYRISQTGEQVKNRYTVLAEHDSIFERKGIRSLDDLIGRYASPGLEPDDPENSLYQFTAYHLLEGAYFLDAFSDTRNYNSFAYSPVYISAGLDIKINKGVDTFGIVIIATDTTWIDYIGMFYQESNINTKNGPIHLIDQVMEYFVPRRTVRVFEFLEDPLILEKGKVAGTYPFVDPELFEVLRWEGPEEILYVKKSSSSGEKASYRDYLQIEGNYNIYYTMPEILPGVYKLQLRTDATYPENATVEVYLDGKKIGSNFNLTSGGTANNPYNIFVIGSVELNAYTEHTIRIKTLIPGRMIWDYVRFEPK